MHQNRQEKLQNAPTAQERLKIPVKPIKKIGGSCQDTCPAGIICRTHLNSDSCKQILTILQNNPQ